ncbi:MAG: acyl--CoA ligase, partial [Chloroflexi bacterium]|nr:acyl--CoA ligase [Chloroflexota bacterium]
MRSLPLGPTPSESPSAPARDRPASIAGAFLDVCRRTPDKPCLLFEGETYSYAHLREEVVRWARALRSWGVQPGDRAALFLENSPTFVAAYLGAHLAGAIVVLVNTQYRQVELRHILGDAEARLCITGPSGRAELERVVADLPALEAVVVVRSPLTPSPSPTRGEGN